MVAKATEKVINIGGEGEVAGALNVQGEWILREGWRASRNTEMVKMGCKSSSISLFRLVASSIRVSMVLLEALPVQRACG